MNKQWKRMIAFTAVVCIIFSMTSCATPEEQVLREGEIKEQMMEDKKDSNVSDKAAMQLVKAEYPQMAQYPETDGYSVDEAAYAAWQRSKSSRVPATTMYQNGIREFYEITMQEFLKDTQGENKVYSPLNVYMALAMLAETAEGESRQQILDLLHAESMESLRHNASLLWNANYSDEGTVTSILAGSVWLSDAINYNSDTLKTLAEYYYASSFSGTMGSAEYNKMLQDWLNEQTGGLLEEQAGNIEMDPVTVFALATTVYFQAKWQNEFNEKNNSQEVFHASSGDVTTEFMHQSGTGTYYWGENFSAISRGLKNCGSMLLILPDEGVGAEELLQDKDVLEFIYDSGAYENKKTLIVNQSVPKFDVVSDFSLVQGLKNLGVTDVFDAAEADFTPLLGEGTPEDMVALSEAKHAARVMIDEEGCTAAAFTVMIACGAAMPPKEQIDFVLDRPFLFVINGQDGQPLFVGIVNQPK